MHINSKSRWWLYYSNGNTVHFKSVEALHVIWKSRFRDSIGLPWRIPLTLCSFPSHNGPHFCGYLKAGYVSGLGNPRRSVTLFLVALEDGILECIATHHSFIHLFIQQAFIECLLCAPKCTKPEDSAVNIADQIFKNYLLKYS